MPDLLEIAATQPADQGVEVTSDARAVRLMSLIFSGFLALWLLIPLGQTVLRTVPAIVPPLEERGSLSGASIVYSSLLLAANSFSPFIYFRF